MHAERKIPFVLINTLLLYIPHLALTHRQNHRQRNELILVELGNLRFLQVNPGWAGITYGSSRLILVGLGNLRLFQVNPGWAR